MKSIDEQDHYEVLEVVPGVSQAEIERAYQLSQTAYADDSLALYSVFDESDAAQIRARVDEAYRVLADPQSRDVYDTQIGIAGQSATGSAGAYPSVTFDDRLIAASASAAVIEAPGRNLAATVELPATIDVFENLAAGFEEDDQEFDGAALRRARVRRGIEIHQIAEVTKVSASYLRYLEDERFEELPASVYVRGFVTAYARAIGIDPQRVAQSYMPRVEAVRDRSRRTSRAGRN